MLLQLLESHTILGHKRLQAIMLPDDLWLLGRAKSPELTELQPLLEHIEIGLGLDFAEALA